MSDRYLEPFPKPKTLRERVEAGRPKPINLGGKPHVATIDDWKYAYHRKVAEFAAETLRTSQLMAERDRLRAEVAGAKAEERAAIVAFLREGTTEMYHYDDFAADALSGLVSRIERGDDLAAG